jgi:hypothetical protein
VCGRTARAVRRAGAGNGALARATRGMSAGRETTGEASGPTATQAPPRQSSTLRCLGRVRLSGVDGPVRGRILPCGCDNSPEGARVGVGFHRAERAGWSRGQDLAGQPGARAGAGRSRWCPARTVQDMAWRHRADAQGSERRAVRKPRGRRRPYRGAVVTDPATLHAPSRMLAGETYPCMIPAV